MMTETELLSLATKFQVPGRDYVAVHKDPGDNRWLLVSPHRWIRCRCPLLSEEGSLRFDDPRQAVRAAMTLPSDPDQLDHKKNNHVVMIEASSNR